VYRYLEQQMQKNVVPTGLLYLDTTHGDMHDLSGTVSTPLAQMPFEALCPGSKVLEDLQDDFI
jgi:2-oxoglutarate ferredoxin oxidoreductase subunit beta